jgi:hypothetical protein
MRTIKQITDELAGKSKLLHDVFEEAGEDMDMSKVKSLEGDSAAKVEKIKSLNKELDDLGKEKEKALELDAARKNANSVHEKLNAHSEVLDTKQIATKPERKSIGDLFVESKAVEYRNIDRKIDIDIKTLFQTSAGWDPEATRISRVELYPLRAIAVVDYIPMFNTNMDTIKYMKETTFTNNAAEASAGGAYGEAALAYTETSDEVEKIAVWLPCTDEQLEDVPGIADFLNQRLTYMLRARLDSQILNGDGSTPNLLGTMHLNTDSPQEQALGSDSIPDAVYKGMTKVRATGFAEPSVCFFHPNDWQTVRLLTTADGIYIFGSPQDPGVDRIWGIPVLQTTAATENTAVVGDYRGYSALYVKRGLTFAVTNSHSTDFIYGKQAIRCDMRCSMVHFRYQAFCDITGI